MSVAPAAGVVDCWPRPVEELVLQAGLGEGAARDRALSQLAGLDVTVERLSPQALRLLPLALQGARAAGASEAPWMVAAEAVYAGSWQRHERASPRVVRALRALAAAGVPVLVLKGWALGDVYEDPALRPASDLDLLVPAGSFEAAARALAGGGFRPLADPGPTAHAQAFTAPDLDVDLHHHALEEFVGTAHDAALWADAVAFDLFGHEALRLAPIDRLLLTCTHGLRWTPAPALHWIADATLEIRTQGDALDWDRLAVRAEAFELALPLRAGLDYLSGLRLVVVPPEVLRALHAVGAPWARRVAFEARQRAPERRGLLHAWAVRHEFRRRARRAGFSRALHAGGWRQDLAGLWRALRVSLGLSARG
ncbi:MAG: nucleotidyltransferase family protein [Vicinamibacteria bacterium]|nr:nucleotidyltransferase family protein [Vicinamibacteria bacterium]